MDSGYGELGAVKPTWKEKLGIGASFNLESMKIFDEEAEDLLVELDHLARE